MYIPIYDFLILFFFNDTPTTEIYTLSLHDALPISHRLRTDHLVGGHPELVARLPAGVVAEGDRDVALLLRGAAEGEDRKSTRLNSSHGYISYAVFCLKKKISDHYQPIARLPHDTDS